jgi:hypothetical protein
MGLVLGGAGGASAGAGAGAGVAAWAISHSDLAVQLEYTAWTVQGELLTTDTQDLNLHAQDVQVCALSPAPNSIHRARLLSAQNEAKKRFSHATVYFWSSGEMISTR